MFSYNRRRLYDDRSEQSLTQEDVQEQGEEEASIEERSQEGDAYDDEEVGRTLVDVDRMGIGGVEGVEVGEASPFPKAQEEGEEVGRRFVMVQASFEVAKVEREEEVEEEMVVLLETLLYVPKEREQMV